MSTKCLLRCGPIIHRTTAIWLILLLLSLHPAWTHAEQVVQAWEQRYSNAGSSGDLATKVVTDAAGNVIMAGSSTDGLAGPDILVIKYSNAGVASWTNRYNGSGNASDQPNALAVDSDGNVFIAGSTYINNTNRDYVTIKYSSAGVPLWTNYYNGPWSYYDQAYGMALDTNGNVYVAGTSHGGLSSYEDYATIKYSGAGVPLWTNRYNGPGNSGDQVTALALGSNGNVFVSGNSYGGGSGQDYATISYSGAGVSLWTNYYNGPASGSDYARALAVDTNGNVFVSGYAYNTNGDDYVTIKYSGAGVPLWTNRYNGPSNSSDDVQAMALDGSGNVIVTGSSYQTNGALYDCVTIKYSGAGVPLWTNRYDRPGKGYEWPYAVSVDGSGNAFVIGYSMNTNYEDADCLTLAYSGGGVPLWTNRYKGPGNIVTYGRAITADTNGNVFAGLYVYANGNADALTIKFSGAGVPLWTNRYNGPGNNNDNAYAVAVDAATNVYVTGGSMSVSNNYDYATIKYSAAGLPLWTNRYNGPGNGNDYAQAIATDKTGNVFVTGYSTGSGGNYDYITLKYSAAGVPLWTNRYDGPGGTNDSATAIAVDAGSNVLVSGRSYVNGTNCDYATIQYSNDGVPLWTNRYNGSWNGEDYPYNLALDSGGNVFVTGISYINSTNADYLTIKYSSVGLPLWTNRYNGPANDYDIAYDLALDANGNVFVTGYATGSGGNRDFATIKYSNAGAALWTNRYNGPGNGSDIAIALALDTNGNVFVTGYSYGSGTYDDYTTIKYSNAGVPLWTNRYNGPVNSSDYAMAVAVDASGNVFTSGWINSTNGTDCATIKYSNAGAPLWTNLYNGPAKGQDFSERHCLAIGPDGAAYLAGYSDGDYSSDSIYDYITLKLITPTPPVVTVPPASLTNFVGTTAAFSVTVSGTEPFSYQWRQNGTDLPGANTNSYTISSAQFADAGDYTVVITNVAGSVTSAVATLTVSNRPPVANNAAFTRNQGAALKIYIAPLLTNYTSDPDGDTRSLTGVGSPAHGSLSQYSQYLYYAPDTTDTNDSFSYTISDGRGGSATGNVQITRLTASGQAQGITPGPGGVTLRFAGIPGFGYAVERATDVGGPWSEIQTTNAPATGIFTFTDPSPPQPSAYYRLKYKP